VPSIDRYTTGGPFDQHQDGRLFGKTGTPADSFYDRQNPDSSFRRWAAEDRLRANPSAFVDPLVRIIPASQRQGAPASLNRGRKALTSSAPSPTAAGGGKDWNILSTAASVACALGFGVVGQGVAGIGRARMASLVLASKMSTTSVPTL